MDKISTEALTLPDKNAISHMSNTQLIGQTSAETSAKEFETAFIAQMLQYSGLADALTSSGGEDMQSFSQFYLEALAKKISDNGGLGIAEKIYTHIKNKEGSHDELGRL